MWGGISLYTLVKLRDICFLRRQQHQEQGKHLPLKKSYLFIYVHASIPFHIIESRQYYKSLTVTLLPVLSSSARCFTRSASTHSHTGQSRQGSGKSTAPYITIRAMKILQQTLDLTKKESLTSWQGRLRWWHFISLSTELTTVRYSQLRTEQIRPHSSYCCHRYPMLRSVSLRIRLFFSYLCDDTISIVH